MTSVGCHALANEAASGSRLNKNATAISQRPSETACQTGKHSGTLSNKMVSERRFFKRAADRFVTIRRRRLHGPVTLHLSEIRGRNDDHRQQHHQHPGQGEQSKREVADTEHLHLEKIILIDNNFEEFHDELLKLPKLKELNISKNQLKTFNREIFNKPTIELFYAFANPLIDFDEREFNYDYKELKTRFAK